MGERTVNKQIRFRGAGRFLAISFGLCLWACNTACSQDALASVARDDRQVTVALRPSDLGDDTELLKVLTDTNGVSDILVDGQRIWFATWGGVKCFDKQRKQWDLYTRHDGLAANRVLQLAKSGDELFAFHSFHNHYSVLREGEKRWEVRVLDSNLQGPDPEYRAYPGGGPSHFVVYPEAIWCVVTHVEGGMESWPIRIEVHQYERARSRLLRTIEIASATSSEPQGLLASGEYARGLVGDGDSLWLAMSAAIFEIDRETGALRKFSPPRGVTIRCRSAGGDRGNRIVSIAADEEYMWLGLERGLARFDKTSHQYELLLYGQTPAIRGVSDLYPQKDVVWLACHKLGLHRYDKASGSLAAFPYDEFNQIGSIAATDQEVWVSCSSREGIRRLQLPEGTWELIAHPRLSSSQAQVALFENRLYVWWRAPEGGGILSTYDLSTDQFESQKTARPLVLVPDREKLWFISSEWVRELSPLTGQWRERGRFPLQEVSLESCKLVAVRGTKYWLYAYTLDRGASPAYAAHFLVFDTRQGTAELVITLPEELRDNAHPCTVGERYLYVGRTHTMARYDLMREEWEEFPLEQWDERGGAYALGKVWSASGTRLFYFSEDAPDRISSFSLPRGDQILSVAEIANGLEVVTQFRLPHDGGAPVTCSHVLHYDGSEWRYAVRKPVPHWVWGLDRRGALTELFAVAGPDGREVTVWRGTPPWHLDPEDFAPVSVSSEGSIQVPMGPEEADSLASGSPQAG